VLETPGGRFVVAPGGTFVVAPGGAFVVTPGGTFVLKLPGAPGPIFEGGDASRLNQTAQVSINALTVINAGNFIE
jgi:hypothetical protein